MNDKGKECGGVILADTEDWKIPVCNACYEGLGNPKQEPHYHTDSFPSITTYDCEKKWAIGWALAGRRYAVDCGKVPVPQYVHSFLQKYFNQKILESLR